jgi:Peptidase C10 family/Carboxypeptidase regulatory-like domain/Immunoglobulin domain/Spi protease inhibitor
MRKMVKGGGFKSAHGISLAIHACIVKLKHNNSAPVKQKAILLTSLLWLASFSWLNCPLSAAPVGTTSAADVVTGWLTADPTPFSERLGHKVNGIETIKDETGTAIYHVVHLAPSGFVIVAADDQIEPIVAFAAKGTFDHSTKNALKALADKDLPARLAQARLHPNAARFVNAPAKWRQFEEGTKFPHAAPTAEVSSISTVWVAPFLQSLWDQQTVGDEGAVSCYNYYTPPYAAGSSSNYPSGCVATAMAQMLYYYQFPTAGVGTKSFTITVNGTSSQASLRGGNGEGGPYPWSTMPANPQNPTTAQCQAIGAVTYDAGVAVNMEYAPGGSGATLWAARNALSGTFLYPNAIIGGQDNPNYSLSSTLISMVNPNLDARMPVMFGIWASGSEGHCVVCDGYGYLSGTLYHHLNMGWSGYDNAWYALPDIDAANVATFTNISSCIYNVSASGTGEIISGRIVDTSGNPVAFASVTAARSGGATYGASSDTNGIYALVGLPSSSQYTLKVIQAGYANGTGNWSTGASQDSTATTGNVWGANFVLAAAQAPVIVDAPQSQTSVLGAAAAFTVTASGSPSPAYQWQFDGGNLADATNSSLSFNAVQAGNAGSYEVVVSNAFGAVTSAPVTLSVTGVPVSFGAGPGGIHLSGGAITLSLTNLTGQGSVVVESSTDLTHWVPVATNAAAFGGFHFTNAVLTNVPCHYYRAVVVTAP